MNSDILNTLNVDEITHSDIMVVGVGGAGGNALNNMIDSKIYNVTFMACNTDQDALENSKAELRLQLGNGKGAGNNPAKGRAMALESLSDICDMLRASGAKIVYFTAGMGGGTGTGSTPVIARAARELHEKLMQEDENSLGILTVAVVTTPFTNEGPVRVNQAREGIEELRKWVDAILVINNDSLIGMCGNLPEKEAMKVLDGILTSAVKGMAEIITLVGDVNIDLSDAITALKGSGNVLMGTGCASGVDRAKAVVDQCFNSPLFENRDIYGAKYILLDIHYSNSNPYTMNEATLIRNMLQEKAGGTATLLWGNCVKEELGDNIEIVVVASGFDVEKNIMEKPVEVAAEVTDDQNGEPTENSYTLSTPAVEEAVEEAQEVLQFRGVNRYDNMSEIYNTPAIKRYGGSYEDLRPSPAAKKNVVVQQDKPAKSEPEQTLGDGSLDLQF
ncbi:MAG: cell division FtsZ family protein [Rikenellaceae bacterium]|nr:cell division FtsZ family protein [Rikenellaceae bacterium]